MPAAVAARVRAEGGIADSQMVGDTAGAVAWTRAQPNHNGKVGLIGSCSGGRHAFIYACQRKEVPTLTDQHQDYLQAQLEAFAKNERHNDIYYRMRDVASRLTPR